MKKAIILNIFLLLLINSFSYADINNNDLSKLIKVYLKNNNIHNEFIINKKLTLPDCHGKIKIKNRFKQFKTLEVNCLGKKGWTYNIRTHLDRKYKGKKSTRKKVKNNYLVVLTKNNIKKGDSFKKEDLVTKTLERTGSLDHFKNINDVIGKVAKSSIRKNQIVRDRHLVKNWTIKEGQKVIIENNRSNIQILIEGIATKSAMQGEYLEVLNKSSGDIIKAWVKNNKKVSIFR